MSKRKTKMKDSMKVKGFSRMQLVDAETGKVIGDSGWQGPNQVVNLGFQDYICASIGGVAGSKQVAYMAIGTGSVPASDATTIVGETGARCTTTNTVVSSKTLQCTGQFAGSDMGGTCTISSVALYNVSTTGAGTLLCGITYTTSQWASNQNVNATYQLRFS